MQGKASLLRIRGEGLKNTEFLTEVIIMKKGLISLALALVLVTGSISGVSAVGYGNGHGDGTGTGICVNEDCPNFNQERPLDGTGAGAGSGQMQGGRKGQKGGQGQRGAGMNGGGQRLRDGSGVDCVNDGVRPLDGSGMKKGQR